MTASRRDTIDKSSGRTSVVAPESAGSPDYEKSKPIVTSSTPVTMAREIPHEVCKKPIKENAMVEETSIIRDPDDTGPGPGPDIMSSSSLEGDDVVNNANEKLGTIQDIMIDVPHGRVAYAVLSRGGILGMGDKLFAIPWTALTLDTQRKCFVLDIDVQHFEEAEGFDKNDWPRMADLGWATRVHEYYNQPPYW